MRRMNLASTLKSKICWLSVQSVTKLVAEQVELMFAFELRFTLFSFLAYIDGINIYWWIYFGGI